MRDRNRRIGANDLESMTYDIPNSHSVRSLSRGFRGLSCVWNRGGTDTMYRSDDACRERHSRLNSTLCRPAESRETHASRSCAAWDARAGAGRANDGRTKGQTVSASTYRRRRVALCLTCLAASLSGYSALAQDGGDHLVPLFPSAGDEVRQGFVRVINHSRRTGEARIEAVDDDGVRFGPVTLAMDAGETVHFNSSDLEEGNPAKGLHGGVGTGSGDWRLTLSSGLDLEVLSYIRTPADGFLTSMHDLVPQGDDGSHRVAIFNPGSNRDQQSRLRLINRADQDARVTIRGIDGTGASPGDDVVLTLAGGASRTIDAHELESGGSEFTGALGDGAGKWQLTIESDRTIHAMSLLLSPTGHLTNLSTAPSNADEGVHTVPMFPAASDPLGRQGFVRVINQSAERVEVTISAFDDTDRDFGTSGLALQANETVHFNSDDLEMGNAAKGLTGGTGAGEGDWRLELNGQDIEVLAYIRTTGDGFLTAMHDTVPREGRRHRVATFNPASNVNQASRLRLVNAGEEAAEVDITGIDDTGRISGGSATVTVPAGASSTLSAQALETGGEGFVGELGDGAGKWRLRVDSDLPITVMSLLASPTGHLTNLSTAPSLDYAPANGAVFDDRVVARRIVTDDEGRYFDFPTPGRFRETMGSAVREGDYNYTRKGPSEGTLVSDYDDGDRCTAELAFRSRTAATATSRCDDGEAGELEWRVVEVPGGGVGGAVSAVYEVDDTVTTMPTGSWTPDRIGGGSVSESGGTVAISLQDGGFVEVGGYRYTCRSTGGCEVEGGVVKSGRLVETTIASNATVSMPDANLRAAVAAELGKASGEPITQADMATLTSLTAVAAGIDDLTGLESAVNLTKLYLNSNAIADLNPLAGLTALEALDLSDNDIVDISPLGGLTDLERLSFPDNQVEDISALAGLTALYDLTFWGNRVRDISALAGLTELTRLNFGQNNVTDISALRHLTDLREVTLGDADIQDISPLTRLKQLTHLRLLAANINDEDLMLLSGLTNLTELALSHNQITDISPLAEFAGLKLLWLWDNQVEDISALSGLNDLTFLSLGKNSVQDVAPLHGLTNLTRIYLMDNRIEDVSALAGLADLIWLDLAFNAVKSVSALGSLANVTELNLASNVVEDISALVGLPDLQDLDVRCNLLNEESFETHVRTLADQGTEVLYDRLVEGDFDIDLVFLDEVTESQKDALECAARRWMAVVVEDLPDYVFADGRAGTCSGRAFEIAAGERIDDLRIYMGTSAGVGPLGHGGPTLLRAESHLPVVGCMAVNLSHANFLDTALHEIGHVLGFASEVWDEFDLYQNPADGDTHFTGLLATAAFDDAGGEQYDGAKVPLQTGESHWRVPVIGEDTMAPYGGKRLSAITVQSMADVGYGVDVAQADAYILPADAVRSSASRAISGAPMAGEGRLTGRLVFSADTERKFCGASGVRESIQVVDQQGRVIRRLGE